MPLIDLLLETNKFVYTTVSVENVGQGLEFRDKKTRNQHTD